MTKDQLKDAFDLWMEDPDIPLPLEPLDRELAEEALLRAFTAGWEAKARCPSSKLN
ncbi:hypothetical protein [Phaeovulum vinaykumarii]|uniref:Uncharacterized protein n=1 Tax=Phaeovulum vinaykumarii TaxID=407234 RepID=A0A1N7L901_9RHOB|nr:hypothetical protein [Phaeovulum vinaykumarii]SIS70315.1 hypothetical protein SAMN05421795_102706 [Phaeovulum vinaykumarii]SOB98980.1 hypothetical protein SAMN05878426_10266 [Phaeovulum vinaykumarii]